MWVHDDAKPLGQVFPPGWPLPYAMLFHSAVSHKVCFELIAPESLLHSLSVLSDTHTQMAGKNGKSGNRVSHKGRHSSKKFNPVKQQRGDTTRPKHDVPKLDLTPGPATTGAISCKVLICL